MTIANDTVAPATQVEPLQLLLAASMMVQRLRQYANTLHGCCVVCTHHASDITTILNEFATEAKPVNVRENIERCPNCKWRMPDHGARYCINRDCGYDKFADDAKGQVKQ